MKAYYYTPAQCGIAYEPDKRYVLGAPFEPTSNASEVDCFVVPHDIRHMDDTKIAALPHLRGNERRHVFFCVSDRPNWALGLPAIIFRCDANKGLLQRDPTTIPWAWPVKDLAQWVPFKGFARDVVFWGWNSTGLTDVVCNSVKATNGLISLIHYNKEFYGTYETRPGCETMVNDLRQKFLQTMSESRLSLCARSIKEGIVRYRFYEALSMGRVPVHLCDNRALPFADKIDYDRCSIHLPESDAPNAGAILKEWLSQHSDEQIIEMGQYGRWAWETYLDCNKWPELWAQCVLERV